MVVVVAVDRVETKMAADEGSVRVLGGGGG